MVVSISPVRGQLKQAKAERLRDEIKNASLQLQTSCATLERCCDKDALLVKCVAWCHCVWKSSVKIWLWGTRHWRFIRALQPPFVFCLRGFTSSNPFISFWKREVQLVTHNDLFSVWTDNIVTSEKNQKQNLMVFGTLGLCQISPIFPSPLTGSVARWLTDASSNDLPAVWLAANDKLPHKWSLGLLQDDWLADSPAVIFLFCLPPLQP